jgi:hypothetical protein
MFDEGIKIDVSVDRFDTVSYVSINSNFIVPY